MRLETIIDRAKVMGLPLAKDAFRETKENPLPVPPYLVYIVPQVVGRGSDERILLHEIHAALELYTDKVADNSLEKEIEAGIENACKIVTSKQTPQEETDDNAEG
mgnify:CR=1 FL=1